jgi:exonuclease I
MGALIVAPAGEVNRACDLLASDALMSSSLTGLASFRIERLTSANQPGAHERSHEATAKWDGVSVMAIRAAALDA